MHIFNRKTEYFVINAPDNIDCFPKSFMDEPNIKEVSNDHSQSVNYEHNFYYVLTKPFSSIFVLVVSC